MDNHTTLTNVDTGLRYERRRNGSNVLVAKRIPDSFVCHGTTFTSRTYNEHESGYADSQRGDVPQSQSLAYRIGYLAFLTQ